MESGITTETVMASGAGAASLAIDEDGEAEDDDWGAFGDSDGTPSAPAGVGAATVSDALVQADKPKEEGHGQVDGEDGDWGTFGDASQ